MMQFTALSYWLQVISTDSGIKTTVNRELLKKYCNELPECKNFLENFFLTCEPYDPVVNFINYLRDLKIYSSTNKYIKENGEKLVEAFFDILGI